MLWPNSLAQAFYRERFEATEEDGTLTALGRESDLLAWYMAHPETETVKQKVHRESDKQAAIQHAQAEADAAAAALRA